jgi:RloB-like protein
VLVYCGGAQTEPAYFEGLRRSIVTPRVVVEVRYKGVSPLQLLRIAADHVRRHTDHSYDEVWCVVDVDEFDIGAASQEAERLAIRLAVSNPCFELWLLLHHADHRAHSQNCSKVIECLVKHLPAYDKARLNIADFLPGIIEAVVRARALDGDGPHEYPNPSTNVWRLVETVMEEE